MDYNDIINIYKKEKNTSRLTKMNDSFYNEAGELVSQTSNQEEKNNIVNTLSFLKEKRMQKILIYLAYDKAIEEAATHEETELYIKIKNLIKKNKISQSTKVKINMDVPQIITSKGNKLGPYSKNEIVEMNEGDDVKFIIENKIGDMIS